MSKQPTPKRKKSKAKVRQRRAMWNRNVPRVETMSCPECGAPRLPHRVCPTCGKYKGRQVVVVEPAE